MPTDLYDLSAKISADTRDFDSKIAATQESIKRVRDRLKELRAEANTPWKAGQIEAVKERLAIYIERLKTLRAEQKASTQETGKLGEAFRALTGSTLVANTGLGGVASQISSLTSDASGLAGVLGPGGLIAGGLLAVAGAATGAAAGIFKLVESSAEFTGHFKDLSQQTGFSAETLSALGNAAETSGGSLESVTNALFIFETKMGEAKEQGSEMSKMFKNLNIDTTNNEQALRQAFEALRHMTNAEDRATVGKKLFGRGVKELIGTLEEQNMTFDQWVAKLRGEGMLVTGQMAQKGDELSDSITRIGQRMSATGRLIATDFEGPVSSALSSFDSWLKTNQSTIKSWTDYIVQAGVGAGRLAEAVLALDHVLGGLSNIPIPAILRFLQAANPLTMGLPAVLNQIGASPSSGGSGLSQYTNQFMNRGVGATAAHQYSPFSGRQWKPPGGGGGGRGGGGGGGAKQIDEVAEALKRQTREINEASLHTDRYDKEINRLIESLEKKKKSLKDDQLQQLQANADTLRGIDASDAYRDFMQRLKEELDDAAHTGDQWDKALKEIEKTLAKSHRTLKDFVGVEHEDLIMRLRLIDASKKEAEAMQQLNIVRQRYADILRNTRPRTVGVPDNPDWIDLGGGSIYMPDRSSKEPSRDDTRSRRVLPDLYGEEWNRMREFAGRLTDLIDSSIHTGFRDGMKAGLIEFAQGILQMIETKMLEKLADAITDAIMKGVGNASGGSGGGGGWLGKIIGIVLGGVAGGVGGGGGGGGTGSLTHEVGHIGGFATGLNYVPYDNFPAMLHRGERVMTARENQSYMGGQAPVVNIHVNATDARSFASRETRRQIRDAYMRELQFGSIS